MSGFDWYDLPEYYDIVYDVDSEEEIDLLLRVAHEAGVEPESILEPACGGGRLLRGFARRGFAVCGFDRNERSVAYARERLEADDLEAAVFRAALDDFTISKPCDLAHCTLSTFKYMLDEAEVQRHLRCMAGAVRIGGIYIVGLHLVDTSTDEVFVERWSGARQDTRVGVRLSYDPPNLRRRREEVRLKLTVTLPQQQPQHYYSQWQWRSYDPAQLMALFESTPAWKFLRCYDFDGKERPLGDDRLDKLVVLRRINVAVGDT
ncbi:MAG TPA: class I SAM-dependent methyltransferase [Candidatus Krumholzibacteria bacterium]|jgi:SAM-dependent methyltransferase